MNLVNNIAKLENLHWAWQKLKSSYKSAVDIWLNEIEIEIFEGELDKNIKSIQTDLLNETYTLKPIHPVAYPKDKDSEGNFRTRPAFYINVRDQLTWIAVLNVVGANYDYRMPFWSYGHRLHISTWIEGKNNSEKIGKLKYGWYRNTTKSFYRNWKQSWPRFRHHITLTIKAMSGKLESDREKGFLTDQEIRELETNSDISTFLKNQYFSRKYWTEKSDKLFWCSIDLKKFYPSINIETILKNFVKYNDEIIKGDKTYNTLKRLLDFKISSDSGWTKEEIEHVLLDSENPQIGLPTGLIVSGFLSNIAMLEVDIILNRMLSKKEFACFRFVDDYVIISQKFENLKKWFDSYSVLVKDKLKSVEIAIEKVEPKEFREYINGDKVVEITDVQKKCSLDPENPTPLVTQTLLKLSLIASQDINFLTDEESQVMINDLKHFLLTDFADHEIKKETQVSFGLTMLSKLIPELKVDYTKVHELRNKLNILRKKAKEKYRIDDEELSSTLLALKGKDKELGDKYSKNGLLLEILNQGNDIKKEIKIAGDKYHHQTKKFYYFFINVVFENFSKPKLWLRLIEYCSRVGYSDTIDIFNKIDDLKDNQKIDNLNYEALNILCINIISEVSLRISRGILNNDCIDFSHELNFLKKIFTGVNIATILSKLEGSKYDSVITRKVFVSTTRVIADVLKLSHQSILTISKLNSDDKDVFNIASKDRNEIIFWLYRKICIPSKSNNLWINLAREVDLQDDLNKIICLLNEDSTIENVWKNDYRVVNHLRERMMPNLNDKFTLQDYLALCSLDKTDNLFYSEFSGLNIMLEVIHVLNKSFHGLGQSRKLDTLNLHPSCFIFNTKIPKHEINSWDELTSLFAKNKGELLSYSKSDLLTDRRYVPDRILEYDDIDIAEVYAFGIMLWQICFKQRYLPNELYIDNGRFFSYMTNDTFVKYYPSSYSDFIIKSCISPISRESVKWINKLVRIKEYKYAFNEENKNKGYPPVIRDLIDLEDRLLMAIDKLKQEQLSVKNNVGRQLVYISFKSPSIENDILKYE